MNTNAFFQNRLAVKNERHAEIGISLSSLPD
jgi:hypothetical protein